MALIDKASLLFVPSVVAQEKAFNILPSGNRAPDSTDQNSGYDQTRADFDFDRGSNAAATRIGSDGLIKKYRENLLTYSQDFEAADWTTNGATLISGQSGYNGTNDAFLLESTNTGSVSFLQQLDSNTGVLTFSIYAKSGTTDFLFMKFASVDSGNTFFDLNSGSVVSTNGIDATIEDAGSGWYRCSITSNTSSHTRVRIYPAESGTSANSNIGDNIFIQNAQLESGLVSTDYLDSTSVTGKAGVLIDLPRIDYSSGAGALLLEPSRVNKIQYSEYFGDSSWNNSNEVTRSISGTTSPEGVLNAYDIIPTTANTNHTLRAPNLSGFTSGAVVNVSFFAKENGYKFISVVGGFGSSNTPAVVFNLEDGTIESGTGTIEDFGNGWYRCVSPITLNATALYCVGTILNDSQSGSFSGDGVKGISVYGYQIEEASYPTSYIPNHGESGGVTRAADSCSVTGVSDILNDSEGTFFVEIQAQSDDSASKVLTIGDGTSANRVQIFYQTGTKITTNIISGTVSQVSGFTTTYDQTQNAKVVIRYANNNAKFYLNGSEIASDTSVTTPTGLDRIVFNNGTGASLFSGFMKQLIYFDSALTDAECITLTTL